MSKVKIIEKLFYEWDTMIPEERKALIYSLLGHRMKFETIAKEIAQPLDEVKKAWKGDPKREDCGHSAGYMGIISPTCYDGTGCKKCWSIYSATNHIDISKEGVKIGEAAPEKAIYTLPTFDEILDKYRKYIGWHDYQTTKPIPATGPNDPDYIHGVVISDIHAPFHDEQAFAKMISETKGTVDICILGGDGPDFHNYSKYSKYGQHFTAKDELNSFQVLLAILSESFPQVIMIPGNHDERVRKKYVSALSASMYQDILDFHGANAFDFSELLTKQFDNVIIPAFPKDGFAEYRFVFQLNDIIVGHPELFSKIPNKSVGGFIDWIKKKAEPAKMLKGPVNVAIIGHTHQAGKCYHDYGIIGIENGCLCMTPDYDSSARLFGAWRPRITGYTRFKTNRLTLTTDYNDVNFIKV